MTETLTTALEAEASRLEAQADALWTDLKAAEKKMEPYKQAYQTVLTEWGKIHRKHEGIKAMIESQKEAK